MPRVAQRRAATVNDAYRKLGIEMAKLAEGLIRDDNGTVRCFWAGDDALYCRYHDDEWGMPSRDEQRLFEKLCLEGFQSGLSWLTILRKRDRFREQFHDFDWRRIAKMTAKDVERLLKDPGIIRHRGKIESTINNAKRMLEHFEKPGAFAAFVWSYEPDGDDAPRTLAELRTNTTHPQSHALSKALKKLGFSFVGPTTCYAFMQAMGLVDDHIAGCDADERCRTARRKFKRPKT
jgi:DNA-3-methyladenine glycosylase I